MGALSFWRRDLWQANCKSIVFEIELSRQIEINIDYILMLVKKYRDSH